MPDRREGQFEKPWILELSELVSGARDLLQKMRETSERIHEMLDDFIKDNKLRLEKRYDIPRIT